MVEEPGRVFAALLNEVLPLARAPDTLEAVSNRSKSGG